MNRTSLNGIQRLKNVTYFKARGQIQRYLLQTKMTKNNWLCIVMLCTSCRYQWSNKSGGTALYVKEVHTYIESQKSEQMSNEDHMDKNSRKGKSRHYWRFLAGDAGKTGNCQSPSRKEDLNNVFTDQISFLYWTLTKRLVRKKSKQRVL